MNSLSFRLDISALRKRDNCQIVAFKVYRCLYKRGYLASIGFRRIYSVCHLNQFDDISAFTNYEKSFLGVN